MQYAAGYGLGGGGKLELAPVSRRRCDGGSAPEQKGQKVVACCSAAAVRVASSGWV